MMRVLCYNKYAKTNILGLIRRKQYEKKISVRSFSSSNGVIHDRLYKQSG